MNINSTIWMIMEVRESIIKQIANRLSRGKTSKFTERVEDTSVQAFNNYLDRISKSQNLGHFAGYVKEKVKKLGEEYEKEKNNKPDLTIINFLSNKTQRASHLLIPGGGWSTEAPDLVEASRTVRDNETIEYGYPHAVKDLLGKSVPDLDKGFKKKKSPFGVEDSVSYSVRNSWGGKDYENSRFSEWQAPATNENEKDAGIIVCLMREDTAPTGLHIYFTGKPGGVRGFALRVKVGTLAKVIETTT